MLYSELINKLYSGLDIETRIQAKIVFMSSMSDFSLLTPNLDSKQEKEEIIRFCKELKNQQERVIKDTLNIVQMINEHCKRVTTLFNNEETEKFKELMIENKGKNKEIAETLIDQCEELLARLS